MVGVGTPSVRTEDALVEQLVVDAVEGRAVGACKHALRKSSVGIFKTYCNIYIVVNLNRICGSIVGNRTDCQFADTNTTHCTQIFNRCNFVGCVGVACVCSIVDYIFHSCRVNILADRSLLCRQGIDVVVGQRVFRFGISVYRDYWRCTLRNCNHPCNHWK